MKRNKLRVAVASITFTAGLFTAAWETLAANETGLDPIMEGEFALELVNRTDILITEEFIVTEMFANGDLRAEKTVSTGEGMYLTKEQLEAYELELHYDEVIRISWVADDYWSEDFHKIESIEMKY